MVRDSIRSLVLPPCCIQAGMAFWYFFIFKVVFSWISVWLFVLSYSYYSFKGCELMYLGFALMYGSLPWAIFPSD
jgi:hypothetical protein